MLCPQKKENKKLCISSFSLFFFCCSLSACVVLLSISLHALLSIKTQKCEMKPEEATTFYFFLKEKRDYGNQTQL